MGDKSGSNMRGRKEKKAKRVCRGGQKTRGREEEGGNGERRGAKKTANLISRVIGPLVPQDARTRISDTNLSQSVVGEPIRIGTRIVGLAPLAEPKEVFPGQSELSVEQFVRPGQHKVPSGCAITVYSRLFGPDTYFLKS